MGRSWKDEGQEIKAGETDGTKEQLRIIIAAVVKVLKWLSSDWNLE